MPNVCIFDVTRRSADYTWLPTQLLSLMTSNEATKTAEEAIQRCYSSLVKLLPIDKIFYSSFAQLDHFFSSEYSVEKTSGLVIHETTFTLASCSLLSKCSGSIHYPCPRKEYQECVDFAGKIIGIIGIQIKSNKQNVGRVN